MLRRGRIVPNLCSTAGRVVLFIKVDLVTLVPIRINNRKQHFMADYENEEPVEDMDKSKQNRTQPHSGNGSSYHKCRAAVHWISRINFPLRGSRACHLGTWAVERISGGMSL